jgi:hypothetical protein
MTASLQTPPHTWPRSTLLSVIKTYKNPGEKIFKPKNFLQKNPALKFSVAENFHVNKSDREKFRPHGFSGRTIGYHSFLWRLPISMRTRMFFTEMPVTTSPTVA